MSVVVNQVMPLFFDGTSSKVTFNFGAWRRCSGVNSESETKELVEFE